MILLRSVDCIEILTFQEDLYPETQADIPAITADEWWTQRKNADPVLMSMAEGGGSNTQGGAEELVVKKVIEEINI